MKAVVLAAGEGKRFRPLTETRPKSMLPVAEKPLLAHVVDTLAKSGIDEVVLVVGHRRERIQSHFGEGAAWGVDISYVVQDPPLGTGDALLRAEAHVGEDFLVVNGDRIVERELIDELVRVRRESGEQCMAITTVDDPTQYGMVTVEGPYVSDIVEKPPRHAVTSNLVNAGVYAFGPEIFAAVRRTESRGELDLTKTIADHLDSHPVRAVRYDGLWLELKYPWDLLDANDGVLSHSGTHVARTAEVHDHATVGDPVSVGSDTRLAPGARVLRGSTLGDNVRVGANAVVVNSVVLSDATIGPGTVLEDCIVGESTSVGPNTTVQGGVADVVVDATLHTDVDFGGLLGDHVAIGGSVSVEPGTILGNRVSVEGGCLLSGVVDSDSDVRRG